MSDINECPHLEIVESEGTKLVQNKNNPNQVIARIQDVISFCFRMKCPSYEECSYHEELFEILWSNKK